MISKKSGPPRPPLPTQVKKVETTGQQQHEDTQKGLLGSFSIRFRRDDANESDEEISIVRKENSPDVQTESNDNGKSENSQNSDHSVAISPSSTGTNSSGASSILSTFNLPFLPKNPTLNSGSEGSSFEEQTQKEPCQNSMGEIVFMASHFEQESDASPASPKEIHHSNDSLSTSPPVSRRKDNPIVHSAMSLSSLLKKECTRSSPEGKGHVELPKAKGFVASALAGSSQLLMPIGWGGFDTEVEASVKDEEPITYTEVPLYNMLLVSLVLFLYFMLPSSSFMNGFVVGGILTFFLVFALMWFLTPDMSDEEKYKRDVLEHLDREMKMLQKTVSSEFLQPCQLYQQQDLEVRL